MFRTESRSFRETDHHSRVIFALWDIEFVLPRCGAWLSDLCVIIRSVEANRGAFRPPQ